MCLGKTCAGWGSIFLLGFPCYINLAILEQDDSFFYSSPNTSWQRCGVFFKGTDENFLVQKTKENPDTVTTSLNKAGKHVHLNKMYFKICINNSWLPCKVVSVPLKGSRCLLSDRERWSTHVARNVPALTKPCSLSV